MSLSIFSRRAVVMIAGLSLCAGCGGAQNPVAPTAMSPQRVTTSGHAGKSWMLPGTSGSDLVYASRGCGGTCVFAYPSRKLVGSLDNSGGALCSDSSGNVYLTDGSVVYEYAHGGTAPEATFSLPGNDAAGCSVDPTTGNLAVVFISTDYDIAVFPEGGGTPSLYSSGLESLYCGYDDSGDLFADGYTSNHDYGLAELPAGASSFSRLSITQSAGEPGQIQWDGSYLTYQGRNNSNITVSRLSVEGSQVSIVGTTKFDIKRIGRPSWIYKAIILIPFVTQGHHDKANEIGVWQYPEGGKATSQFRFGKNKKDLGINGVAYSAAPSPFSRLSSGRY